MSVPKTGPLTRDEIADVWRGAVDTAYSRPLEAAGDGNGLEVYGQMWEQFARVSKAIDVTTQAMFICPWSGQTNPSAAGAAKATVSLTFARTGQLTKPLVLIAGQVFYEENTTDYGDPAGVQVRTGRRYTLVDNLVFHPGEKGPYVAACQAEEVGYGYNNPLPGKINYTSQPGVLFNNDLAAVTTFGPAGLLAGQTAKATIVTPNEPDMFVPEQVGQYVLFTAGANAGKVGRIAFYISPVPPLLGSSVEVALEQSFDSVVSTSIFTIGETATFSITLAKVRILGQHFFSTGSSRITFEVLREDVASVVAGETLTGDVSTATADVRSFLYPNLFVAEAGTAAWRMLDWVADWGLTVTNVLSPTGGKHAWLDELGNERNVHRAPGESDADYLPRVREVADVVTPNAIRRALAKMFGALPWCFREVGTAKLPGFFYDGDLSAVGSPASPSPNDYYDMDTILFPGAMVVGPSFSFQEPVHLEDALNNVYASGYFGRIYMVAGTPNLVLIRKSGAAPASLVGLVIRGLQSGAKFAPTSSVVTTYVATTRYRFYLDYTEFRAFFLVGVPRLGTGEFGFAYDLGDYDAYDAAPYNAFYDGYPAQAALFYKRVWQNLDTIRAGGVSFDMRIDDLGCS